MAEIMRDIAKAMSTMPTAEKLAFAEDIFDIRGSLAGLTLTANTDELDAMLAKLQDVEGVAADTAKKMDAGLGGAFRLLLSAVEGAMNAIADAMNSTLQPLIVKVTAVINAFTQWIEANQGLVTAFAVTVAGAAGLAVVLIAIGVAAKGAAAGIAVVQTAIKVFTFLQGVAIAQGTALKTSFTLLTQSFADYRNTAIPALVGTEKFCAALGLASTSANRARASIILMSNAEAAAAAKSALAAKWRIMTSALKNFSLAAIAATAATKAQAAAEAAAAVKTALVSGWTAMANALKGLTLSSIAAATALKAQAVAEGAMAARRALATAWTAMASALKSYTAASIAATVAVKAQTVAEALCTAGTVALNQVQSRNCRDRAFHGGESESCDCGFRRCGGKLPAGGGSQGRGGGNAGSGSGHELYCRSPGGGCADCAGSGSGGCVHLPLPRRILYRAAFGQDEHASGKGRPAPQNG